MFVKYDENGNIQSLFMGCVPDNAEEYTEIPDDEALMQEFIKNNRPPVTEQQTPEERIAALEEQLAAAKILLGVE